MKEKINNKKMQNIKIENQRGITLIALVITIVILIILATVTINMAFGDNGLVKYAEEARDKTANSTIAEAEGMNRLVDEYANVLAEDSEKPIPDTRSEIEKARDEGTRYAETTPLKDDLENIVYIPGGFHVATDSGTKVEEGIVIEDDSGNQFVWIPTGEYKVSTSINSTGKLTNELTRRQWANTVNIVQEPEPLVGDEVANGYNGQYYYGEGDNRSCTISNGVNSIDLFKASASSKSAENENGHGGFYIGRYEQGTGNVCKAGVEPYVNVTRDEAKIAAESMYNANEEVKATTELISSYAWDTALNFICQTSKYGYSLATISSPDRGNMGTGNSDGAQTGRYTADKYSNICDFLGNMMEWTTEYSNYSDNYNITSCTGRGGSYYSSNTYAAGRGYGYTNYKYDYNGFRLQLYM